MTEVQIIFLTDDNKSILHQRCSCSLSPGSMSKHPLLHLALASLMVVKTFESELAWRDIFSLNGVVPYFLKKLPDYEIREEFQSLDFLTSDLIVCSHELKKYLLHWG